MISLLSVLESHRYGKSRRNKPWRIAVEAKKLLIVFTPCCEQEQFLTAKTAFILHLHCSFSSPAASAVTENSKFSESIMEHSPELLKSFANQLARVAGQEDATQALRLLRLTGLLDQPAESAPQKPSDHALRHGRKRPSATQEESVGIWTRKKNTTHFARSLETIHQWPFWANVGRIEQKGTRCRVFLIGESVARGYLLDPQFNPAMALESVLQSQMGMNAVEVIDLARTSMGLEIEELAISALLLEPDAAIIFAGNNWLPTYSKADFPYLGSKLLNDGIAGLKQLNEKWLGQSVRATIEAICSAYQARKVPLTWIVPEFNLGDWRDPLVNAPHLRSGDNRQWMQCWKNAQAALKNNQYDLASEFAEKMVALDQETCVAGLYIL